MRRDEYPKYLYDLFMKEVEGTLHPKKAFIEKAFKLRSLSLQLLERELDLMGIEYEKPEVDFPINQLKSYCVHSLATIMNRHNVTFMEALDPKYNEERWKMIEAQNFNSKSLKEQMMGFTIDELIGNQNETH